MEEEHQHEDFRAALALIDEAKGEMQSLMGHSTHSSGLNKVAQDALAPAMAKLAEAHDLIHNALPVHEEVAH